MQPHWLRCMLRRLQATCSMSRMPQLHMLLQRWREIISIAGFKMACIHSDVWLDDGAHTCQRLVPGKETPREIDNNFNTNDVDQF